MAHPLKCFFISFCLFLSLLFFQSSPLRLSRGAFGPLVMNGREVFKFVSRKVPPAVEATVRAAGLQLADIDWLVLHQANKRIIDAVAERLHLPSEKVGRRISRIDSSL